jgi:hypothetical protein
MKNLFTFIGLLLLSPWTASAQNQVINSSAEYYDTTTLQPEGWTIVSGNWTSQDHTPYTADAHDSTHIFYEGNDPLGVLQQDVNVSGYSSQIDNGQVHFLFSGWVQSHAETAAPLDQAAVVVQALDISKTQILLNWFSDTVSSLSSWMQIAHSITPPPGTRYMRVQLIAIRNQGASNDAYFDDVQLIAGSSTFVGSPMMNDLFYLYPNPVADIMRIDLGYDGWYHYNIISMNGVLMKSGDVTAPGGEIDISYLPPAIYSIQLYSRRGYGYQTTEFIKD